MSYLQVIAHSSLNQSNRRIICSDMPDELIGKSLLFSLEIDLREKKQVKLPFQVRVGRIAQVCLNMS